MPWTQAGSAVVIVAQQFNPSVINQLWLVRNGVLDDGDFQEGSLYSDMVVQVRSRVFHLLVFQEQLQFVPVVASEEQQRLIVDKLGTIVRTLPHTPYRALGMNFAWHLTPGDGNIAALTRGLFFKPDRPLFRHFDAETAHYGGYLSKDVASFRLKLDIKPISVTVGEADPSQGRLQFGFNFHCDLAENAVGQIEERLLRWNEVRHEVEQIVDSVEARQP